MSATQFKLSLHRRLFSYIKTSRGEGEIVRFVVDSLAEYFPGHALSFSQAGKNLSAKIHYYRDSTAATLASSPPFRWEDSPVYLHHLVAGSSLAVFDTGEDPRFPTLRELKKVGVHARLDCPHIEDDGQVGILSVFSASATHWRPDEIELVAEAAELISLFTRETKAVAAARNREAIFRQLGENIDAVFWMADPENRESIYVSPAYDRIWGSPREDLKKDPRAFLGAIVPEDRSRVMASFEEHHRGPSEKFYRIRRPDGAVRWIKDRSFPIKNELGETYRVVGVAEDVTPLKEAQERLESTEASVISSAKLAALGEMASGIAHEINNPLAVILGVSVQLQERILAGERGREVLLSGLATVDKMSKRIAAIVKGLRTFSRQNDGDPMTPSDLIPVLMDTLAICEAGLQGVRVVKNLPAEEMVARCRPSEISQVFVNLLQNARDAASGSPEKTIELYLGRLGGSIYFAVEDSGSGIPKENVDRIFQPFFTTKAVGQGTGLGLSISKNIVEAHGGKLYLDSSAKRTRFVVELPAEVR